MSEPIHLSRSAVVAVMTSFNRRQATLSSLEHFERSCSDAGLLPRAVLVDDGSSDGTAIAVKTSFEWVEVVNGDGDLFWNRGMHEAQARAMTKCCDYLLWLNDDTDLKREAMSLLLRTAVLVRQKHGKPGVIVGSTADRVSGKLTYGGQVALHRWRPFTYQRVWHETEAIECHAMNGNVVLIPMEIAQHVGNVDPVFEHAMGDIDYALRVRAAGFPVYVAPGFVGHCSNNPTAGTYRDASQPFSARWRKMMSRKGLPPRSWQHFTRKHGGPAWPVYFAWPYVKLIAQHALRRHA